MNSASKKLNSAKPNYSTIENEYLGVVWGIKKLEPYLYGKKFTLETDHQPLQYLEKSKMENGQYDFTVKIIKEIHKVGADYLNCVTAQ